MQSQSRNLYWGPSLASASGGSQWKMTWWVIRTHVPNVTYTAASSFGDNHQSCKLKGWTVLEKMWKVTLPFATGA